MPRQSLGNTQAWHWQTGGMLQWVPCSGKPEACIWNDIRDGKFSSRVLNPDTGAVRELPALVPTVHPDGIRALTIDFHRLEDMRPGYGYYGSSDSNFEVLAPANASIWVMDLEGGEPELVVSLAKIATIPWSWSDLSPAKHYFNVQICNPSGTRFLFLHRRRFPGQGFQMRLVMCYGRLRHPDCGRQRMHLASDLEGRRDHSGLVKAVWTVGGILAVPGRWR